MYLTIESGTSGTPGCPRVVSLANVVPRRARNRLRSRHHRTGDAVEEVHPALSRVRDLARVVAQRRRRVHVAKLGADARDRPARRQEQRREGVAEILEPEGGALGLAERALKMGIAKPAR